MPPLRSVSAVKVVVPVLPAPSATLKSETRLEREALQCQRRIGRDVGVDGVELEMTGTFLPANADGIGADGVDLAEVECGGRSSVLIAIGHGDGRAGGRRAGMHVRGLEPRGDSVGLRQIKNSAGTIDGVANGSAQRQTADRRGEMIQRRQIQRGLTARDAAAAHATRTAAEPHLQVGVRVIDAQVRIRAGNGDESVLRHAVAGVDAADGQDVGHTRASCRSLMKVLW